MRVPAGTQQTDAQPSLCARGRLSKLPYELAHHKQCRQCSQATMLCHQGVERHCLCHQADIPHSLVTQHYGSAAVPLHRLWRAETYGLLTVQVDSCCRLYTHAPVLSEQITVREPRVSMHGSWRTMAFWRAIMVLPICATATHNVTHTQYRQAAWLVQLGQHASTPASALGRRCRPGRCACMQPRSRHALCCVTHRQHDGRQRRQTSRDHRDRNSYGSLEGRAGAVPATEPVASATGLRYCIQMAG